MNANAATVKTTQTATGALVPDTEMTRRFLETLGQGEENFTFQYFKEGKDGKKHSGYIVHYTTITEALEEACGYNKRGYGVYVTVNETDGNGRKKENITSVRAVFIDVDKGTPNLEGLAKPSMIIQSSSPGKNHYYWVLKPGESISNWTAKIPHLIKQTGADVSVKDISRVLRVPGFYHLKGEPVMSLLLEANDSNYGIDEIGIKVEDEILSNSIESGSSVLDKTTLQLPYQLSKSESTEILESLLNTLSAATSGNRNNTLNRVSRSIGVLIQLGYNEGHAKAATMKTSTDIGLGLEEFESTWASGVSDGKLNARRLWLDLIYKRGSKTPITDKRNLISYYYFLGRLRLNDFTNQIELDGKSVDIEDLTGEIKRKYIGVSFKTEDLKKGIIDEAKKHLFSPVKDYLDNLPKQDPTLIDTKYSASIFFGDESDIAQICWVKWCVAAYRRGLVLSTDSKDKAVSIEGMLIIQSEEQGIGKTEIFRKMTPYNVDFTFSSSRDDAALLRGSWIAQMSEFETAHTKKDTAELKEFLTKNEDTLRTLYSDSALPRLRHTVLCGSTNSPEFLKEDTNRRYWVIKCTKTLDNMIPLDLMKNNRNEFWGVIKAIAEFDVPHTLSGAERELLGASQKEFIESDPREEIIQKWLESHTKGYASQKFITVTDACLNGLYMQASGIKRMDKVNVKRTLIKLGCTEVRHRNESGTQMQGFWTPAKPTDN